MLNGVTQVLSASIAYAAGNTVGLPLNAAAITAGRVSNVVATPIGTVLVSATTTTPTIYIEGGMRPSLTS